MTDILTFDMNCDLVHDFHSITNIYIDPNFKGNKIHNEIKEQLSEDKYLLLKKILVGSDELDIHLSNKPDVSKIKSVMELRKANIAWNKKNN